MSEQLVLIDGNSILNRAYFAMPPLNDRQGRNVNAVYGFVNILLRVIGDYSPTHLAVAFDMHGVNFRKEIFPLYKANRKGMPDDMALQMPILHELLSKMNIEIVEQAGIEADDIIGTLSKRFHCPTLIVTGDRDLLQLIDDSTTVLLTKRGVTEVERVDQPYLLANYSLTPEQVIEYKSLRGDSSDNIPGVKGIGDISAMRLIAQYGNIDNVYADIDNISGSLKDKLVSGKEMAYVSRKLATIVTNVDIDCQLDDCLLFPFGEEVKHSFELLDFNSLIKRLDFTQEEVATPAQQVEFEQIRVADQQGLDSMIAQLDGKPFAFYCSDNLYFSQTGSTKEYCVVVSDNFLDGLSYSTVLDCVKRLLSNDSEKTVYDAKTLKHLLYKFGIALNNVTYDLSIMQYLVEYRAYKDMAALCSHYGVEVGAYALNYIATDLIAKLNQTETTQLYKQIELPLMQVLFEMEVEGVKIDIDCLDKLHRQFTEQIDELTAQAFQLAGEKFNVLSPKQLSVILFDKLGLNKGKKTKTGFSTDNDVLVKLYDDHPIVPIIIKIRQLSKLNGTYVEGLKPLVAEGNLIHTSYNQTLTSTGRLSSSEPNLQNIPIHDDIGKEIRRMFVPKYGLFVSADYSQIELRLLAHFSNDANLIKSFNDGNDIHRKVASEIFQVPQEMITDKMRRTAKAVNFGIIYGISGFGLSENIGITPSRAREYIKKYFDTYPTIKDYLDSNVLQAREYGYVTTLAGRRRQIPEIKSSNFQLRSFGERAAMNMPLQGSAADVMKIAMINVFNALNRQGLRSRIVMQVHDELIVDTFAEEEEAVKAILKQEMENAVDLKVKLTVNIEEGVNLYESK